MPKQSFTVVLDDVLYDIAVLETNGCMSLNITRAGERIVSGQRAVTRQLVLPYASLEDAAGNFMFLTQNDELPAWDLFTTTQAFVYASNAELLAVRGEDAVVVTGGKVYFGAAGHAAGAAVVAGVGAHV